MRSVTIERRDIIKSVRQKFIGQYRSYHPSHRFRSGGPTVAEIISVLEALDLDTASVADIDAAIGIKGWGSLPCEFCGEDVERLTRIGEEPDYEARWVDICRPCLTRIANEAQP